MGQCPEILPEIEHFEGKLLKIISHHLVHLVIAPFKQVIFFHQIYIYIKVNI